MNKKVASYLKKMYDVLTIEEELESIDGSTEAIITYTILLKSGEVQEATLNFGEFKKHEDDIPRTSKKFKFETIEPKQFYYSILNYHPDENIKDQVRKFIAESIMNV